MAIGKRMYWIVGLVAILALAGAAVTLTSRLTSAGPSDPTPTDTVVACSDPADAASDAPEAKDAADTDSIEEQCGPPDAADVSDTHAAPGQLDDGADLQSQAKITIDEAVAAAQGAATGDLGEVDLEHYQGKLVYNVDIGNNDVKVDANDASILATDTSD